MPSAQKNSQATVTGVGDACPEPFRESPFPSLMLAWTLARGQAAELPHRAPLGHHMPPSLVVPPPHAPAAACVRSLTSHGTQDWSGSLWLPCSHECKAAAGSRTHSWGRCQGLSGSRDGLAGLGDPDTAWVVPWQQPLLVITPYLPFSSYPCGTGCGEPGLCWDRAWGRLQLRKPLFSAGLTAVAWPPGLCV